MTAKAEYSQAGPAAALGDHLNQPHGWGRSECQGGAQAVLGQERCFAMPHS